jgi:hypothetical protein
MDLQALGEQLRFLSRMTFATFRLAVVFLAAIKYPSGRRGRMLKFLLAREQLFAQGL